MKYSVLSPEISRQNRSGVPRYLQALREAVHDESTNSYLHFTLTWPLPFSPFELRDDANESFAICLAIGEPSIVADALALTHLRA